MFGYRVMSDLRRFGSVGRPVDGRTLFAAAVILVLSGLLSAGLKSLESEAASAGYELELQPATALVAGADRSDCDPAPLQLGFEEAALPEK